MRQRTRRNLCPLDPHVRLRKRGEPNYHDATGEVRKRTQGVIFLHE